MDALFYCHKAVYRVLLLHLDGGSLGQCAIP